MEKENITIAVPKHILTRFMEIAIRKQKTVSGLMIELMEDAVTGEEGYRPAHERHMLRMAAGMDLGTQGKIAWNRDDRYER